MSKKVLLSECSPDRRDVRVFSRTAHCEDLYSCGRLRHASPGKEKKCGENKRGFAGVNQMCDERIVTGKDSHLFFKTQFKSVETGRAVFFRLLHLVVEFFFCCLAVVVVDLLGFVEHVFLTLPFLCQLLEDLLLLPLQWR